MAKVAIVLNSSWNIYNFRLPLLEKIAAEGHSIAVIAPRDTYTAKIPYEFHHIQLLSRSTNPAGDFFLFCRLFRLFRRLRPDAVLLYTIKPNVYGNFAAWLLNIPTISNIAGLGNLFVRKRLVTDIAKLLYRLALLVPAKVFFQNNDDLHMFLQEKLVQGRKAERIPGSGVDLARFSTGGGQAAGTDSRTTVFLLVARMLWDKGIGEYVAAAGKVLDARNDAEFRLLGFLDVDNPNAISPREMTLLTSREGITYLGVSDAVENQMRQADCIVLPTYYREGVPRSLLEAGAMGKPIICTDVPGCRDVVLDGENGLLCKARDSEDLYRKMVRMLEIGKEGREEMGRRSRRKMEKEFSQDIVIDAYLQILRKICS